MTGVDVLFGLNAVDPRPGWVLSPVPLELDTPAEVPVARLSVRRGRAGAKPDGTVLRAREDGKFKIVQVSDTHMLMGGGVCRDAIDAQGEGLPKCQADPLTVEFIGRFWMLRSRILWFSLGSSFTMTFTTASPRFSSWLLL